MTKNRIGLLLLCTALVGCGSGDAPFGQDATNDSTTDGEITSDRQLPPGTTNPEPDERIFRKEARDDEVGNGFAESVSYDSTTDTFSVDNLPFDGNEDEPYIRSTPLGSFGDGQYAVYEAVSQSQDGATNRAINQFTHRAIYGVSRSGQTEFAIVRTGAYAGYGFGGFVYERDGVVTLPTQGQARYDGQGAGLRDYQGRGGLDYITEDVQIAIDFDDFNEATGVYEGAVDGFVFNKEIFDLSGNRITEDVIARINANNNSSLTAIPTTVFSVGPNVLDRNGEIQGEVTTPFGDNDGQVVEYGTGQYFGIISGDGAEELVGIVVTESTTDTQNITVRDTIGFNIYR
ncbi:MAG: hypothetical protein AAF943_04060 [Pseudomonadota bacterium]